MATMIGIYGEPGLGKTSSLKGLPAKETFYCDCDGKGLNYKGWRESFNKKANNYFCTNEPDKAIKCLEAIGTNEKYKHVKYFVVDTVNNLMTSEEMRRSQERGFDKWSDLASYIWRLVELPSEIRFDCDFNLSFSDREDGRWI